MKILDLGCGVNKWKSDGDTVIGLDMRGGDGVDVVHNIENLPLPFEANTFDLIIARSIMEHIRDLPKLLDELYRILKPGGSLKIWSPHFSSPMAYACPEHLKYMSVQFFDYYYTKSKDIAPSYYSEKGFIVKDKKLNYTAAFATNKVMVALGRIMSPIVNLNHKFYEKFLSGLIICDEVYFELMKPV